MDAPALAFPLWLRLWHWSSAVLMVALLASGLSLHYADPRGWMIPFDLARRIHIASGLAMSAAYVCFVIGNLASGNGRHYWQRRQALGSELWRQARYYGYDIFRGLPQPFPPTAERRFNALQQVVYTAVMYGAMPVLMASGLVFMIPTLAPDHLFGIDGLLPVALLHMVTAFLLTLFIVGHIYLGTTGRTPTSMIRAMLTGRKAG